ncbi:CvpA family protein [Aequorivita marina]|uniref:CvpA family protein n=1 Tax=Aequorivita marina TaxID=3073654 RepID=UPI002874B38B|nr:CvpA family protein [Aequorivita sp. S2608]MDS1298934.1 CvpA family protein [Aequorivita sp. S2608]
MNTIDLVIGIILLIAFFMGFRKGLLRSLAALIGLVVGVYGAMYFSDYARVYIERWFDWSEDLTSLAAFLVTFLLIMIVFSILGRLLTKVANFAMMGIFNKLFGGVFNALKFAFLISVIFMFVNASEDYRILSPEQRADSVLYEPVASLAPAILPAIMNEVDELNIDLPEINNPLEKATDSIE